ncbi:MAG: hypothetical protein FJ098_05380 [Deltaproteobacteria bacterium]|nr:hypothetical protein [Deltaproteobacteria bacterium]
MAPRGRPPIPPSLAQVVVDACHPDPARRPAKARDLARALAAISPPSPGAAPPETRAPEPVPEARLLEEEPPSPGRQDSAWQHLETTSSLAEGRRYLVAARLPPSRITSRDERRWLATLVEASGRGFTLGAHLWFALQREAEDPRTAQRRGEEIIAALARRYGDAVSLRGGLVDRHFALSGAAMVGGAPLPEALQALIRALSEAGPGP